MKVYIFADMEGISGVSCRDHVTVTDKPELYADGCRLMAEEMNSCIEGCFRGGATEVVVRDGHGSGLNVDPARIDSRARLIQGAAPGVRFPDFEGTAALILLGYHAKAGTPGALLEHTYSSASYQNIWLNGIKVGELAIDAAIAAEYNVPVILASGDDKTRAEAARFLPGVPFCQVKTSDGLQKSVSLPNAHELLIAAAEGAVNRRRDFPLLSIARPATMRVEVIERHQREDLTGVIYPDADDCRIYEKSGDSVERLLFDLL